jgi:HTH-type transcriptional regulator, transcriptional repressor of NAD biosynthesis genes
MATTNSLTRIALLGAESTGKTQLSLGLARALRARGQEVHLVSEYLRTWCEMQGRTPEPHEQAQIAQRQADAVLQHTSGAVIADTTPVMTAVYSHKLFNDVSLYAMAAVHQRVYDMTLVTGLDLPWVADGLQRDGPHVREPIDALVRAALQSAGVAYTVVYGQGEERLNNALLALGWDDTAAQTTRIQAQYALNRGRTAWTCDTCSDAECEHRLFSDLLKPAK